MPKDVDDEDTIRHTTWITERRESFEKTVVQVGWETAKR